MALSFAKDIRPLFCDSAGQECCLISTGAQEYKQSQKVQAKEVPTMPTTKEFTVFLEDRPGTLGKVCRALSDRNVNILAFQSLPSEGKGLFRFVADNPATAKTAVDAERLTYTEAEVAQAKLPHRPGELARAASRLGEANININYAYGGLEAGTNAPIVIFGVAEVGKAVAILDQVAAAAAGT